MPLHPIEKATIRRLGDMGLNFKPYVEPFEDLQEQELQRNLEVLPEEEDE